MKRALIIFLTVAMTAATMTAQEKRMAVVETSTCYMRIAPDYESALETQELMGTVVEIVGEQGYWREIVSPQPYKAWTTEKTLVEMTGEEIDEYIKAPKYMFTELYGHIYTKPSEKSQTICDLVGGDVMRMALKGDRTDKAVRTERRAVTKGKWAQVVLPSGRTGWVCRKALRPLDDRIDIRMGDKAEGKISQEKMEDIIASAMKLVGVPYMWGGMSSKGVDCSGLVRIACIMNDVLLPRNASQQIKCGVLVELPHADEYNRDTALKATSSLERGDLVFFGKPATEDKPMRVTHVGIYLGDNHIIHASHLVRINSLIPGDEDYYENAHRLIAACRLVN